MTSLSCFHSVATDFRVSRVATTQVFFIEYRPCRLRMLGDICIFGKEFVIENLLSRGCFITCRLGCFTSINLAQFFQFF